MGLQYNLAQYWSQSENKCVAPSAWRSIVKHNSASSWTVIDAPAQGANHAAAGLLAFADTDRQTRRIFRYQSGSWSQIGTPGVNGAPFASSIVVGDTVYATDLDANNGVYAWKNDGTQSWTKLAALPGGYATSVVFGNGLYATNYRGFVYNYQGGTWVQVSQNSVSPSVNQIVGSPYGRNLCMLTRDKSSVQCYNGSSWNLQGGPAGQLFGAFANLAATSPSGDYIAWQIGSNSWRSTGGPGFTFALAAGGTDVGLFGLAPDLSYIAQEPDPNSPFSIVGGPAGGLFGGGTEMYGATPNLYE